MNDGVICIGGPLHKLNVENGGSWFQINKEGDKEYFVSTILNTEYTDKYILNAVYPTMESKEAIKMYVWESNTDYIKQYFHGS
ncbi:hypothetical protein [Acinetobacter bereziniae]|uniref:hypothetical protein n=1 Tax=Acinetobacter bereziniae TaxID=106648 RepID=UPI001901DCA6|nr:hypothetical protein [Acinetobacter bereziniae]MBJ9902060.1 hypothetical protein [Acinetobacter bereziniae]MCU4317918.1 hypothetical protein [Acinetobacter bereziniae]MCU4597731.1 hypothetical protein [Acinetobacter bereziniae]